MSPHHAIHATPEFQRARNGFRDTGGYLAAASMGVATAATVAAQHADLELWADGSRNPRDYEAIVERTRASYAALVGVPLDRVAIGSQTSSIAEIVAAAVPAGREVLCVEGDFSSIVYPFLQRAGIRVRHVLVSKLADSIADNTWLVVFSHIQSATGEVADVPAITASAAARGAFTFCDTTQSAGVHPVDAGLFDATVCHAYKWLCAPRGVAFLTVSEGFQRLLVPTQAGWYAGEDIWGSCYGPRMQLAQSARRFDVSPAWPAWVGAEPAIAMFAGLDMSEVWAWASGLGDDLCRVLGTPPQAQAIVSWPDPDGSDLVKLTSAGLTASGRAGRLRVAFHLWNGPEDVVAVVRALDR